jgi:hypothetical protein
VPVSLRQLRAPRQDGAVVAEPPLSEAGALLADNRRRLARAEGDLLGRPLHDLRREAREALLAEARDYLAAGGEPLPAGDPAAVVMAGHQPELFHPGVWVKHFALHGLAHRHGATAVNLVVDNDTAKSTALRIPALSTAEVPWPHVVTVPFDRWGGEVPYEEATVRDEGLFADFPDRAAAVMRGWDFVPLLPAFWQEVLRQAGRTPLLGERFASARRAFERRWGCHNLEVPVSRVCRTEPFAWFACHLLAHLPRFHALYNDAVREYRRAHGIRSRNHPVPELTAEGDWLELPFWGWRSGQTRRGRLMARFDRGFVELRAGGESWGGLPRLVVPTGERLVDAWRNLQRHGYKIRSRALTNTLYARLLLCDLFVHGIGGGKYDELTDVLLRRFYGLEPPGYLVLSATLLLPLPAAPVRADDRCRVARALRDVHYNPQRHLDNGTAPDPVLQDLVQRKQHWIARQPQDAVGRRERFRQIRALTAHFGPYVAGREHELRQELARVERQLEANAVVQRRDYAFCLYPEAPLRAFCIRFL